MNTEKYIAFIHFDSLFTFYLSLALSDKDNLHVIEVLDFNYENLIEFINKLTIEIKYFTNLLPQETLFKTLKSSIPPLKSVTINKDQKTLYQDYYASTNTGFIQYNRVLRDKIIEWTKIIDQEKFIYAPQLVSLMYLTAIKNKPITCFDRLVQ
jgi:hypothetical protein